MEFVYGDSGEAISSFGTVLDITERKRSEEEKMKQARYAALRAEVSASLAENGNLRSILRRCAECMVRHLDLASARIWTLDEGENMLELEAGAGMYTHPDDRRSHIPVGNSKMGLIVQERLPHLSNDVVNDPRVHDREWAEREGMVAFAGYPLIVDDRVVGAVEMFARHGLGHDTIEALGLVSSAIAQGIQRKRAVEALRESEERFRLLAENAQDLICRYRFKPTPGFEYVSPSASAITGYTPEEYYADPELGHKIAHPDDRHLLDEAMNHPDAHSTIRWIRKDRKVVWTEQRQKPIYDEAGELIAIEGIARDVTQRKEAEEALRSSEEFFRALYENVRHPIFIVDIDLNFVDVNPYACEFYGYSREEFRRMNVAHISLPEEHDDQQRYLELLHRHGGAFIRERRHRKKNGEIITVTADVARVIRSGEEMYVAKITDITERKRAEDQLSHQAFHDPLTGLPNRALLSDRLGHALARADRNPESVAILFLDLDNFKVINDSLGHKAGDELLVSTAERLRRCLLRPGDTVARLSGDEFTVLLEDMADRREAIRLAERIAERMGEPFVLKGREAFTTTSIGIAFASSSTDQPDDLLRKADIAMYRAKGKGKSGYMVFDPGMDAEVHSRLRMESDLRRAIERDEFVLHYQIKVELDAKVRSAGNIAVATREDRPAVGEVEALVRWQHPDRGLLEAMEFIPLAEETGLILPMGLQILEKACKQVREWQQESSVVSLNTVCVNLSGRQFQDPGLVEDVGGVLRDVELDPGSLELEITESVLMQDVQAAAITLRELKELGVRIAIDDFGMGYSSLSYLKNFPVDILKIDRSFVERLGTDPASKTIVAATIDLAHALGMRVVAEGVETAGQLEQLIAMGCEAAQGFYFSRPVAAETIPSLLSSEFADTTRKR